jgi:hypothetical protein
MSAEALSERIYSPSSIFSLTKLSEEHVEVKTLVHFRVCVNLGYVKRILFNVLMLIDHLESLIKESFPKEIC